MTGNADKQRSGTHVQAEGDAGLSVAESCLRFINSAWTQYHAVGKPRRGAGLPGSKFGGMRSALFCTVTSWQIELLTGT